MLLRIVFEIGGGWVRGGIIGVRAVRNWGGVGVVRGGVGVGVGCIGGSSMLSFLFCTIGNSCTRRPTT